MEAVKRAESAALEGAQNDRTLCLEELGLSVEESSGKRRYTLLQNRPILSRQAP